MTATPNEVIRRSYLFSSPQMSDAVESANEFAEKCAQAQAGYETGRDIFESMSGSIVVMVNLVVVDGGKVDLEFSKHGTRVVIDIFPF